MRIAPPHMAWALLTAASTFAVPGHKALTVEAVVVHVRPNVAQEPAKILVTVDVPRNADNRYVIVEAESGTYARSSQIPLDGAHASRIHELFYEGLPAGKYVVGAMLFDRGGQRAFDRKMLIVLSD